MDLHEFLRTRRSTRRFRPDPVPAEVVERILTTATFAPSAHHRQPWRFAVLTSFELKGRLAEAMGVDFRRDLNNDGLPAEEVEKLVGRSRERILTAPVAIVLCMDASEMDDYPDARRKKAEYIMTVQSVAAAGLQLLLAAHAEGLGGVWVCAPLFTPETVRATLELPEGWEPQAMFFVGYPNEIPKSRDNKLQEEVTLWL